MPRCDGCFGDTKDTLWLAKTDGTKDAFCSYNCLYSAMGAGQKIEVLKGIPSTNTPDLVNQPPHYTSHPSGIECIQITEHMSFNLGNAFKYIWRADLKGGVEDLEKARWYVDREIRKRGSNGEE